MNSKTRNERVGTALLDAANEYECDANLTDIACRGRGGRRGRAGVAGPGPGSGGRVRLVSGWGRGRGREEGYGWCRVGASPGRHCRSAVGAGRRGTAGVGLGPLRGVTGGQLSGAMRVGRTEPSLCGVRLVPGCIVRSSRSAPCPLPPPPPPHTHWTAAGSSRTYVGPDTMRGLLPSSR